MTKTKVTEFQKIEEQTKKQFDIKNLFFLLFLNFCVKRTKEIGESSKTILQKKTNKSSNSRSSTTLNNTKQQRNKINQDYHLSPTTNNQLLASERPLRF